MPPGGRGARPLDGVFAAGQDAGLAIQDGGSVREIVRIEPGLDAPARPARLPPPSAFPSNGLPEVLDLTASKQAQWDVSTPAVINPTKPLLSVKKGDILTLSLHNKSEKASQTVHIHGHSCRILHPNDDGWEPYWVDTLTVKPSETVRIAFRADNPGNWMIESHACVSQAPPAWTSAQTLIHVAGETSFPCLRKGEEARQNLWNCHRQIIRRQAWTEVSGGLAMDPDRG